MPLRLTKLTHTSVFPKPLQRQSVPLVCQVFHEKTIAAFRALKSTIDYQEGTIKFITLITNWFKMMNVKDKFSTIHLRDPFRAPWTLNCDNFSKLSVMCDVIDSCRWEGGRYRQKKLTQFTADAFKITTKFSIAAATYLFTYHNFQYVLPAVFSQDPLEKIFGQARQRNGGNFYIDIVDVLSSAKAQRLHQLLKYNIIPQGVPEFTCPECTTPVSLGDIELMQEISIEDTELLLDSGDTLKHKVVFIAGYITFKHGEMEGDPVSTEFLQELDRGGLRVPTLSTTCFVQTAVHLLEVLQRAKNSCRTYVTKVLSFYDHPLAEDNVALHSLVNTLLKAQVNHFSDLEQQLGCLRRREKLQEND